MRGSRQLRLALVLLLLTAFTLTALDFSQSTTGPLGTLRRGIDTVVGPVQRTLGGGAGAVGRALGGLPRLGSYQSDNRRLQRENDALRAQLRETALLRCQAAQWDGLLHLQQAGAYAILPAHVTSLGAAFGFERTAVLDAGSRDGLRPDMTVVTGRGLVGRTKQVSPYTATVLLLSDPQVVVGTRLGATAALGTTRGTEPGPVVFELNGSRPSLQRGDVLFTAGSTTYPPGIPVGTLTSVAADPNALTRSGQVAPFVDLAALDLVGVITNGTRTRPRTSLAPPRSTATTPASTCSPQAPAKVPSRPVPRPPAARPATPVPTRS